jgi:hypothetical protein
LITSGDSLLDRSLLEAADDAIAPAHGELYRIYQSTGQQGRWVFTQRSGLYAGEEIAAFVQSKADALEQLTWGERSS